MSNMHNISNMHNMSNKHNMSNMQNITKKSLIGTQNRLPGFASSLPGTGCHKNVFGVVPGCGPRSYHRSRRLRWRSHGGCCWRWGRGAPGLGGGLRARFLDWYTIICMDIKRSTTKNLRSSPNPSSASNAEVGLDFTLGACGARYLLETRARPDFFLGIDWTHGHQSVYHKKSCGQPKFPPRWLHRERGGRWVDAHRFRVMNGGFGIWICLSISIRSMIIKCFIKKIRCYRPVLAPTQCMSTWETTWSAATWYNLASE